MASYLAVTALEALRFLRSGSSGELSRTSCTERRAERDAGARVSANSLLVTALGTPGFCVAVADLK
jgi:hypothetical protein